MRGKGKGGVGLGAEEGAGWGGEEVEEGGRIGGGGEDIVWG